MKKLFFGPTSQRIRSNAGWSIINLILGKSLFFFINIYLARVLGVSNFGLFALAQTTTQYFWLAADLGTNMYGVREIAKNKENIENITNPLITMRVLMGLIICLLYVSTIYIMDMPHGKKMVFAGAGLYLFTYAFYFDWILRGFEQFKYVVYGNMVSSVSFLVGVFLIVKGENDVFLAGIIWAFSFLIGGASLIYLLFKKIGIRFVPLFDLSIWYFHIKESICFTISGALIMLYQYLPIFMLSFWFSSYTVGIFAAPYKLVMMITTAMFFLPMAFYPVLADLYLNNKEKFKETHIYFQVIMGSIGILIASSGMYFSSFLLMILFGEKYSSSLAAFKVLIWFVPLATVRYSYGTVFAATGFLKQTNLVNSVGLASMILFGFLLIPQKGTLGGAWALVISEFIILLSYFIMSRLTFNKKPQLP